MLCRVLQMSFCYSWSCWCGHHWTPSELLSISDALFIWTSKISQSNFRNVCTIQWLTNHSSWVFKNLLSYTPWMHSMWVLESVCHAWQVAFVCVVIGGSSSKGCYEGYSGGWRIWRDRFIKDRFIKERRTKYCDYIKVFFGWRPRVKL